MPDHKLAKKKIIFITFNRLGYACLETIINSGLVEVIRVYTLKPELTKKISDYRDISPLCKKHKIEVKKIKNINQETSEIKNLKPDIIFIIGWSQIVKPEFFKIPPLGCIGFHPALLPKNRGRSAIPWHFINEEKYGGATLFFIDEGCDSGEIIGQSKFLLTKKDNARTYYERMQVAAVSLLQNLLPQLLKGDVKAIKQNHNQATYLLRRSAEDSFLDFCAMKTNQIFNQIRAVAYIYPSAFAFYQKRKINILESAIVAKEGDLYSVIPGQIIKVFPRAIWIKTIDGIIELSGLSVADQKPLSNYNNFFSVGHYFNK